MKEIIKAITPPIVLLQLTRLYSRLHSNALFDGDDSLFKRSIHEDSIYAEYGCGASTIWVTKHIGCKVFSVDSSREWIDRVNQECSAFKQLTLHFVDIGSVGAWGRPVSYDKSGNFADYTDWIWAHDPDVVLVDGRFRVCCFLTCLISARRGTKILFDDYTNRPLYHIVEQYLKPAETCGRQAMFIVPSVDMLDISSIRAAINNFRFVLD